MHAGLDLDLGLGSHAGQDTRDGPKSLLVSDGVQSKSNIVFASELIIF
jgi:hypothetical protein